MKLYRGFIIDETKETDAFKSESSVNIAEMIEASPEINPHNYENANKFLWSTPDEGYAKKVNIARFITMMTFDPEFADKVKEGKIKMALATYEVLESNVYEAEGKTLEPYSPDSLQYIIQSADKVIVNVLSNESYEATLDLLETKNKSDTIGKAVFLLEQTRGVMVDWSQESSKVDQMPFIEGLKYILTRYFPDVLTNEVLFENIAEGLFAASFFLSQFADHMSYNEELEQREVNVQ